jgi:hypothetical protein
VSTIMEIKMRFIKIALLLNRSEYTNKHAGKAFRLYVKNLDNRFVLRGERLTKIDEPGTFFMNDAILSPLHLIESKFKEFFNIFEIGQDKIYTKIEALEEEIKIIKDRQV